MQDNPSDTTSACYNSTAATNAEILKMADFTSYLIGGFNAGEFLDKTKVMNIKFIEQMDQCSYNEFLINLDTFLSNIPQAIAGGANIATQVGTGWAKGDTSVFISINKMKEGWNNNKDWVTIGAGAQLFAAELLKVSAGNGNIAVAPTSY